MREISKRVSAVIKSTNVTLPREIHQPFYKFSKSYAELNSSGSRHRIDSLPKRLCRVRGASESSDGNQNSSREYVRLWKRSNYLFRESDVLAIHIQHTRRHIHGRCARRSSATTILLTASPSGCLRHHLFQICRIQFTLSLVSVCTYVCPYICCVFPALVFENPLFPPLSPYAVVMTLATLTTSSYLGGSSLGIGLYKRFA